MNQDQLKSGVRWCVTVACGYAVQKGWIAEESSGDLINLLVPVGVAIAMLVWGLLSHSNANKVKAAAAVDKGIKIAVPEEVIVSKPSIGKVVSDRKTENVVKAP